jgi:MoCo/4Fe-4S cofactor protein with predicted Tat translocation signal
MSDRDHLHNTNQTGQAVPSRSSSRAASLDFASIRQKLAESQGEQYWRNLQEIAETGQFTPFLDHEFPEHASEGHDPVGRRNFLKLMGASLGLAGLTACTKQPKETILPYIRQPEEVIPGRPLYFATTMPLSGFGTGLLVESHEGRPTKIEGNPDHPSSLGATDLFCQASVLTLYDPDRSQTLTYLDSIRPWSTFLAAIGEVMERQRARRGAGLRILTETVSSPTLAGQIRTLLAQYPAAKWHQYEPVNRDSVRAGTRLVFGEVVNPVYHLESAAVVLSLDSNLLAAGPGNVRYARDFANRRRVGLGKNDMNRLYVVESVVSNTGSIADHRLAVRPSEVLDVARAIASELGISGDIAPSGDQLHTEWIKAVVRDLQQHCGSSLIVAGDQQLPEVHALAHAMNYFLKNVGNTVVYTESVEAHPVSQSESLRELVRDMEAALVDLLVIIGGNPVYTAPADLAFAEKMAKVGLRIHLSLHIDETSQLCHWQVPEAYYLESWSDVRCHDGTASIIQPLIAPLYNGKTAHEVLAVFSGQPERTSYDIVRDYWKNQLKTGDFETSWRRALHDGFIADSALPAKSMSVNSSVINSLLSMAVSNGHRSADGGSAALEIVFQPDPTVYDGRFANNAWLQELPKPLTKITWDNVILVSPATAERLGLSYREAGRGVEILSDIAELRYLDRSLKAPVWVLPGHPDGSVTVHLGNGRWKAGRVGTNVGFNAYALRTASHPWFGPGAELRRTGENYPLANTQVHHQMDGRNIVRSATLDEYRKDPEFARSGERNGSEVVSFYPQHKYEGYAWGMAVDQSSCIGCNACVIACVSENNIPVVGKTEVMRGREMHWIRIDTYHKDDLASPESLYQPMFCQHCEKAPCEVVCPVGATVHSAEGLNDMVYNRCVGTKYCSNNCPYKVRRFNFFLYSDWDTSILKLLRNPDVTVRSRGVMEKCTFCVQRINHAKIEAEKEDRFVRDGEIVTACQAACPTKAIVFGNINDPNSQVSKLKAEPRNYSVLGELNTTPRTTYLAALRNPNPELKKG